MKQLLVLSGKGGTGKTTLVSSFIELGGFKAFADCDVDAPNLNLISGVESSVKREAYYGMDKCVINPLKCDNCGICREKCRFNAIDKVDGKFKINKYNCEGCGVCKLVCPNNAISFAENIAGEIEVYSGDKFLSTAELKMGEGNSGLLVTEVKKNLMMQNEEYAIVDGSPGIGCPVIASIAGAHMVIVVTEPSLSGLSDLDRIVKTTKNFGITPLIVINKYDINLEKTKLIEKYAGENSLEIIGRIPFEEKCNEYLNEKKAIVNSNTAASLEIKKIYNKTMEILRRI